MSRLVKWPLALLIFFAFSANAFYNPGTPTGFVNDYAGIFNEEQKQALENKLLQFEKESSNEISIVAVPSLQGDTIENFSVELFKQWGIGKKNNDNGVLILIAFDDRQIRIEVGYGLEGALTDAQASWIINDIMKPAFQEGKYYEGIDAAVNKIISATSGEYVPSDNTSNALKKITSYDGEGFGFIVFGFFVFIDILGIILGRSKSFWLGGLIGAIIGGMIGFLVLSLSAAFWFAVILGIIGLIFDYSVSRVRKVGKGRGWWIGGGRGSRGGGGFGGFGGGISGGGGVSGRW